MKIHLDNVNGIFTALWVAKRYSYNKNLKYILQIEKGKGITNTQIAHDIRTEYEHFKTFNTSLTQWERYESYFKINFAIIAIKCKDRISFLYKSSSWQNMIFLRRRTDRDSVEYMDLCLKDIFPLLPKEDSFISLPLSDICKIFDRPTLNVPLTGNTHNEWQMHARLKIKVYKLIDGQISHFNSLMSAGNSPYEVIRLIAKDPKAYEEVY